MNELTRSQLLECALVIYGSQQTGISVIASPLWKELFFKLRINANWPGHKRNGRIRACLRSCNKSLYTNAGSKQFLDIFNDTALDTIQGSNGYSIDKTPKDQTLTDRPLARTQRDSKRVGIQNIAFPSVHYTQKFFYLCEPIRNYFRSLYHRAKYSSLQWQGSYYIPSHSRMYKTIGPLYCQRPSAMAERRPPQLPER